MLKKHLDEIGFTCERGFYSLKRSRTQKVFIKIDYFQYDFNHLNKDLIKRTAVDKVLR